MITWLRRRREVGPTADLDRAEIRDAHEVVGSVRTLVERLNLLAERLEHYVDEQEGTINGPIDGHA